MINSNEVLGLRVESILPSSYKTNVDQNTQIILEFNSDLDTKTIIGNFIILEDKNISYINGEIDTAKYEIVEGMVTYKDKSIIFTPKVQLNKNSRYIIKINKGSIKDILGRTLLADYVSFFDTGSKEYIKPCNILEPLSNSVMETIDKVVLDDLSSSKYIIQISKNPTFENAVIDIVVDSNIHEEQITLKDGLYYMRAKAVNGDFGDSTVVIIKSQINTPATDNDYDEDYIYEPIDEELELLYNFPEGASVHEKTNLIYMKFNKIVPIEEIDFYESTLVGELSDEEDIDSISEHGEIDGSYTVVYDEENNETYIFFIPEIL